MFAQNNNSVFGNSNLMFQSNLPACQGDDASTWTNCSGTERLISGVYVGEYKDGNRNGRGSFTFSDGRQYIGEWKDNDRNGQGALTFISDDWYVGKFKDNKFNGQGTFSFSNGNKYVGEFKDNERNGQGVVYNFGGVVIQSGFFEKGVLVNSFALDKNRFPISQC